MHSGMVGGLGTGALRTRIFVPFNGGASFNGQRRRSRITINPDGSIMTAAGVSINIAGQLVVSGSASNSISGLTSISGTIRLDNAAIFNFGVTGQWGSVGLEGNITTQTSIKIGLGTAGGAFSTTMLSDATANVFALRNVTNAQTFRVYRTTDLLNTNLTTVPINFERLELTWSGTDAVIQTISGGTGSDRALIIRTADTDRITIAANGHVTIGDGLNINTGTVTGSQIGTAATQKLGFWGATPVVRPAALVDVTGGVNIDSECRATLNNLLARLRTIGIITP